jgi:WD40 repeat protein
LVFAKDSDSVIAAGDGALIQWFSLPAGKKVAEIKTGHNGSVVHLAITPNGKFLATGAIDRTVKVWDLTQKKETACMETYRFNYPAVALTPDGKRLLTAGPEVTLWEVASQKKVDSIPAKGPIDGLAVSPDGKLAAWVNEAKQVVLWDLDKNQKRSVLNGHNAFIWYLAFSPNSKRLASASADRTVRIWDTVKGKEILSLKNHNNPVSSVAFSPDGKILVTGSGGVRAFGLKDNTRLGEVTFWDTTTGKLLFRKQGDCPIKSVAFSPIGRWVTASHYEGILVFEVVAK